MLQRSTKSIDCVRFSLTNTGMPPSHSIADHLSFPEISTYRRSSYQSGHGQAGAVQLIIQPAAWAIV